MISNDSFDNNNGGFNNDYGSNRANGYATLTPIPLLQSVRVASPCNAVWEDMKAVEGERVHFCMGCQKNVYNLSAMSQNEAEGLLRRHEGRLCVRYFQRHDGTVLTGDCPIGAQMVRMSLIRRSTMAAGLFAMLFGAMAAMNMTQQRTTGRVISAPSVPVAGGISIAPPVPDPVMVPPVPDPAVMGKMTAPQYRPTMGAMTPLRPSTQEPAAPAPQPENLPSEPDTTDAALLKPR